MWAIRGSWNAKRLCCFFTFKRTKPALQKIFQLSFYFLWKCLCALMKLRIYKLFHYKFIFKLLWLLSTEIIHLKLKQPARSQLKGIFFPQRTEQLKKNTSVGMAEWVSLFILPFYVTQNHSYCSFQRWHFTTQ